MSESRNLSNGWESFLANEGITRRTMLDSMAVGGLAAAMAALAPGAGFAAPNPDDEVVRIGYIPITDATALLTAHAMGYFEDEGTGGGATHPDPRLVAAGRGLRRRQVQPGSPLEADPGVDALQQ